MDQLAAKDVLELEVSDFGPIVNAKIDLRPLTVFVGPSNTGKSYLAILIYALHVYFTGRSTTSRFFLNYERLLNLGPSFVDRETLNALNEFLKQVTNGIGDIRSEKEAVLPIPIVKAICSMFELQNDQLHSEIERCFGIDSASALIRKGNRRCARIVLRKFTSRDSASFEHELILKSNAPEFVTAMPNVEQLRVKLDDRKEFVEYYDRLKNTFLRADQMGQDSYRQALGPINHLLGLALPHLVGSLYRAAFYLPADRTGVMNSHQVVVSALIQNATTAGLRPDEETPMLSGVLGDFLQNLLVLPSAAIRQSTSRKHLGARIEDLILGGSIQVERSELISYPHFTYQPSGWKHPMPLMNASSMVSEIAPVVMFLRHLVSPGCTLIIEEPESHLHPAMQVEFTRQIAALVKAGVRVIITTHSEWVLEELANIVRRSELSEAQRAEIKGGEFALRPAQVGAWLFKPKRRPKGSVVEEIRFDPDAGGLESDFSEVGRQLYNDWATIGNRIAGSTE